MKKLLPLLMLVLLAQVKPFAQDFTFTEVPNPMSQQFAGFLGQTNNFAYVSYFDQNFNSVLYAFDGNGLIGIGGPSDLTYSFFLTQLDNTLYLAYNDINFNQVLVTFEEATGAFTQIGDVNANEFLNGFVFELNGFPFFTWFEFINFTQILRYVDGDELVDVALPVGFTFGNYIGSIDGISYVTLQDQFFNQSMFAFDGASFAEIALPAGFTNPFAVTETDEGLYVNMFDINFNSALFLFDGTDFFELPMPSGLNYSGFVGNLDGLLFFGLEDNNFVATLYSFDGTDWVEFPNPSGTMLLTFNAGQNEDYVFPVYTDDFFTAFQLGVCDGTALTVVESPLGFSYNAYEVDYDSGILTSFTDNIFNPSLQFYDFSDLIDVPAPDDLVYNDYHFEFDDLLYFSFRDFNFNLTLYYLGSPNEAPTGADNTIYTLIETPYSFDIDEFNFADIDVDDTLSAIQIVTKPEAGILHLDGANIGTGDIIDAVDIDVLTYVPFNDGMGMPYDSFEFKVFDGMFNVF